MVRHTMTRKLLRLLFICSLLVPPSVFALGIGQIEVNSALNQPLDAEINLNALEGVDLERFSVSLASPDAFSRAGIERSPLLRELEFSVEARPGGQGVIKVTSPRPIREPILDFLVELSWPQGRLLREFAILLEPTAALARPARPVPAPTPTPRATTAPSPPVERGTQTYGPVPYGDTLWNIAQQVRHPAIGMQEMMQALLRANPQAFSRPDIDYLLADTTLRIPSPGEIDPRYAGLEMPTPPQVAQVAPPAETPTPYADPQRQPDQVRLMPPDAVSEDQPQPAAARTVSETAARPTSESTPSLSPSFRIQLQEGRPQLQLAGLEDLRDTLARVDTPTLSAIQSREEALSPPSTEAVADEIPPEETFPETAFEEIPAETEPLPLEPAFEETLPEVAQVEPTADVAPEAAPVEPAPVPQVPTETDTAPPELIFEETLPEEVQPDQTEEVVSETAPVETSPDAAPPAEPEAESPDVITDLPSAEEAVDTPEAVPSAPTAETEPGVDTGIDTDQPSAVMQALAASLRDPQILTLSGLLLLLLIGLAFWLNRRSKKSGEVEDLAFELAGQDQQVATEGAGAESDKTVVEPIPRKPKPFRPLRSSLERVDLLLAVGNYKEAEKVVRQAYSEDASNTALASKLLDVHHASGNAEAFFKEAEALQAKLKNKADPVWQHVAHMGRDFYPDHPLFKGGPTLEKPAPTPGEKLPPRAEADQITHEKPITQGEGPDTLDFAAVAPPDRAEEPDKASKDKTSDVLPDLDWRLPDVEPPTATSGPSKPSLDEEEPKTEPKELNFDFDEITSTRKTEEAEPLTEFSRLPDVEPPTATSGPSKPSLGEEEPKTEPKKLDFDFDEITSTRQLEEPMEEPLTETRVPEEISPIKERSEGPHKNEKEKSLSTWDELDWQLPDAEPPTGTSRALGESDLNSEPQLESLDFELDELDKRTDLSEENAEVDSSSEDYVETKLDLALAYLDMGDSAGARSLLEEVMREGSSAQKQQAEEYMERLR